MSKQHMGKQYEDQIKVVGNRKANKIGNKIENNYMPTMRIVKEAVTTVLVKQEMVPRTAWFNQEYMTMPKNKNLDRKQLIKYGAR